MKELSKKKKIIIACAAVALVIAVGVICWAVSNKTSTSESKKATETEVVQVTDENGEPVTDENGEPLTEVAVVEATTQGGGTTAAGGNTAQTTKPVTVKKPDAPKAVSGFKVVKATEDSIEISWDKTDCKGYQISYSSDNATWNYYPANADMISSPYTSTSFKLTKLNAYTTYYFYVRAYNYNEAGVSTSSWTQLLSARTSEMTKARKITFSIKLPMDSSRSETLVLWIDNEKVYDGKVQLNASTFTFTTDKEYKGEVTAWAELKGTGQSKNQKTG